MSDEIEAAIRKTLEEVHIETGRKDEFERVVQSLSCAVEQAARAQSAEPDGDYWEGYEEGIKAAREQVPEGWMLVRKEWQPIMDEVERRAGKMCGLEQDFSVMVECDDYCAMDEAERNNPRPEPPAKIQVDQNKLSEYDRRET